MSERTKDIWNDDDGEAIQNRHIQKRRNKKWFLLTLVVVFAVVIVAAWRGGTGFDAVKRWFSYGGGGGTEVSGRYIYDASAQNRFALLNDQTLVVLSDTSLTIIDQSGKQLERIPVKMNHPALTANGGRAVAYDIGGTELYTVDEQGNTNRLEVPEEEAFLAANLNPSGYLAVTGEKRNKKGCVSVYDPEMNLLFAFHSSQRFVTDAYVTDDNKSVAAVTLGQEESVFVSNIVLYDLTKTKPKADYDITDGLVLAITSKDHRLTTVSDTNLSFASWSGKLEATYSYQNEYLREFSLGGDGFTALLLNRYQSGSVGRLVTVDSHGKEVASLDVNGEIRSLSAAGKYLAVLYMDRLVVYNQNLEEYATYAETDYAKEAIMRNDGSVLLLASDSASIFLP